MLIKTTDWTIRINSLSAPRRIGGDTLVLAIERHMPQLIEWHGMGNAAGCHLVSARMEFRPGILGGRGGVELTVEWQGMPLAGDHHWNGLTGRRVVYDVTTGKQSLLGARGNYSVKTTQIWIEAQPEDCPTPHTFEIRL